MAGFQERFDALRLGNRRENMSWEGETNSSAGEELTNLLLMELL